MTKESAYEDGNESSVDEGAFWHTNMDLFYGHLIGEIVEVEHEQNKYWLASIEYCFKHLILLKWIGNYSEFWIDTSLSNTIVNTNSAFNSDLKTPRRIFPLGFHLQSQSKSQYKLERPTNFLVKPSLYDPSKDPYANIESVDDLLAHVAEQPSDTFDIGQSVNSSLEPANLVLAKCKTKIDYRQEDVDELEAALHNLDAINNDDEHQKTVEMKTESATETISNLDDSTSSIFLGSLYESSPNKETIISSENDDEVIIPVRPDWEAPVKVGDDHDEAQDSTRTDEKQKNDDEVCYELCKHLQELAIKEGHYFGVNTDGKSKSNQIFYVKPKQVFDVGGANHERVFVPGTLLAIEWSGDVRYTIANCVDGTTEGYCDHYWFAYVVKNNGGRLLLRWFLCDEPKFKQGRLELKSSRSRFVKEDDDQLDNDKITTTIRQDDNRSSSSDEQHVINARDITFTLHFCDPRIQTIAFPMNLVFNKCRDYLLPDVIGDRLRELSFDSESIRITQMEYVFDNRRVNLDKDRPLIDHILTTVHARAPKFLDIVLPWDPCSVRECEVLISSSRMTKLIRGSATRVLRPGVYQVKSIEKIDDNGEECLNFIYPFDSAYAVLPLDWADNNQDCLSIDPSRNSSPTLESEPNNQSGGPTTREKQPDALNDKNENDEQLKQTESECTQSISGAASDEVCLKNLNSDIPYSGSSFVDPKDANYCFFEYNEVHNPRSWHESIMSYSKCAKKPHCCIDTRLKSQVENQFKVMSLVEVVHPLSDTTICLGRIRKVVFPLIWIQISADCYTVLPFNSTNIYPVQWCERYEHPLVSLLPPRKRALNLVYPQQQQNDTGGNRKKKKTTKTSLAINNNSNNHRSNNGVRFNDQLFEKEHFNLNAMNSRQTDLNYMLNEKSNYIKIYFNHKCFTGPSLSKSKICSLPQYVGPGPLDLVLEEVVTKIISVAYVPPRILNDLSSVSFKQLLIDRGLPNIHEVEFKAKYQKRVHRDGVPVCISTEDVALYCESICEHIKCCYNLFGLELYDGDDCPGHCRALTKSNKFMKRATYYRDKARAGEFINSNNNNNNATSEQQQNGQSNKKSALNSSIVADNLLKPSRARYVGRGSSESTSSSVSRSEQVNSRASSAGDDLPSNGLESVEELDIEEAKDNKVLMETEPTAEQKEPIERKDTEKVVVRSDLVNGCERVAEIDENTISFDAHPEEWSFEEIAKNLERCSLGQFKSFMELEGIDGEALLLLDRVAILEHLKRKSEYSQDEVNKFCRFVELVKTNAVNSS